MVLLAKLGLVDAPLLRRHRRYAILIAFVIAAIVTPTPDVINQTLMGLPLVVLYEVSIWAVMIFGKKSLGGDTSGG